MEQQILEPFTDGAVEMLVTMLGIDGNVVPAETVPAPEVAATMALTGDQEGKLVLTFTRDAAIALVCEMLAMEPDELEDEDISDGIGEMVNIIAGYAKSQFAERGFHFNLALPDIVVGDAITALLDGRNVLQGLLHTDFGDFEVAVYFH